MIIFNGENMKNLILYPLAEPSSKKEAKIKLFVFGWDRN